MLTSDGTFTSSVKAKTATQNEYYTRNDVYEDHTLPTKCEQNLKADQFGISTDFFRLFAGATSNLTNSVTSLTFSREYIISSALSAL